MRRDVVAALDRFLDDEAPCLAVCCDDCDFLGHGEFLSSGRVVCAAALVDTWNSKNMAYNREVGTIKCGRYPKVTNNGYQR